MTESPRYRWHLLRTGPLRLDGGGMFGVVPRVIWSKAFPPDDQNRILVAQNTLLLERLDAGAGAKRVVIEVGSGDKFGPKMRRIFGLEDRSVIDAIEETGITCERVDLVIVTHLHFDHAGGLTRRLREGETPDWVRPAPEPEAPNGVKLTFPNARVVVQRREWEDARINRSVMTRTYLLDHIEPLKDRLTLVDSPAPYPSNVLPNHGDAPALPLKDCETEVAPGIRVFLVPGHTWGQQAIRFTDDRGRTIVFTPDLLPTVSHVSPAYSLAYDVEPYTTSVTKSWFLREAVEREWTLVLDHEPGQAIVRVRPDGKRWFELVPEGE